MQILAQGEKMARPNQGGFCEDRSLSLFRHTSPSPRASCLSSCLMPLTGTVLSADLFHASETRYSRTRDFLQQSARALANNGYTYQLVLLMILQKRRNQQIPNLPSWSDIDLEQIEQELQCPPHVCLVEELKSSEMGRLWGCVAKDAQDMAVYGRGICLNADMVKAFEREPVHTTPNSSQFGLANLCSIKGQHLAEFDLPSSNFCYICA